MKRLASIAAASLVAAISLAGCGQTAGQNVSTAPQEPPPSSISSAPDIPPPETTETSGITNTAETGDEPDAEEADGSGYIDQVVAEVVSRFVEPGMSEYDMAKAAFDYLIESTSLTDPVGLDLWRIRGSYGERPSFVENRSLSVLLYGIGMCEDYAAAYTMLLRGMGLEAEYVPGLTYSAAGTGLVDHAWTIAKVDEVWYHFDPQLEDNISRRDTTRYKYFMRGDATMSGSHRWGQNLIDSGLLTAEQNETIRQNFLYETCPQDYATPTQRQFTSAPVPDKQAIQAEIDAEFQEYESIHGPLEETPLDIIPPVFGVEGYGPPE